MVERKTSEELPIEPSANDIIKRTAYTSHAHPSRTHLAQEPNFLDMVKLNRYFYTFSVMMMSVMVCMECALVGGFPFKLLFISLLFHSFVFHFVAFDVSVAVAVAVLCVCLCCISISIVFVLLFRFHFSCGMYLIQVCVCVCVRFTFWFDCLSWQRKTFRETDLSSRGAKICNEFWSWNIFLSVLLAFLCEMFQIFFVLYLFLRKSSNWHNAVEWDWTNFDDCRYFEMYIKCSKKSILLKEFENYVYNSVSAASYFYN